MENKIYYVPSNQNVANSKNASTHDTSHGNLSKLTFLVG